MSILDKLDFVRRVPPALSTAGKLPLENARTRLLAEIDAQIALLADSSYVIRTQVKKRSGSMEEQVRKPRSWVVTSGDAAYISVRVSNKVINIGGSKGQFIKCDPFATARTLETIKKWAKSNEADATLARAMKSAARGKTGAKTKSG